MHFYGERPDDILTIMCTVCVCWMYWDREISVCRLWMVSYVIMVKWNSRSISRKKAKTFADLDTEVEMCYQKEDGIKHLVPGTLEACVMRICDIIAYLGKDRQDAVRLHLLPDDRGFNGDTIGSSNAEIINNMVVNIIENSYGKPYLSMDEAYFQQLKLAKTENYEYIYHNEKIEKSHPGKSESDV